MACTQDLTSTISTISMTGHTLDLAVILPVYNERENIPLVIARLHRALIGLAWEAIFVDDDSPDGSAHLIRDYARGDSHIRLLQRVGRRGLASACVEGMMATTAASIAVMDADLQHDETILPAMLARLHQESLDVVVGSRNMDGGSMGDFPSKRLLLSRAGERLSQVVCHCKLTDPMSGFFILRRSFLLRVVRDLHCGGFKILVALLSSSRQPVRMGEVGYRFGARLHGKSKLDIIVGFEYLFLIVNKFLGGFIPVEMALFLLVGGLGLLVHLAFVLVLHQFLHLNFVAAQVIATFAVMGENFFLNNLITFRDRRLRGFRMAQGVARFVVACSFGAWANVIFARALWQSGTDVYLAGIAGIVLGSVWNLSVSSVFTWRASPHTDVYDLQSEALAGDMGATQ